MVMRIGLEKRVAQLDAKVYDSILTSAFKFVHRYYDILFSFFFFFFAFCSFRYQFQIFSFHLTVSFRSNSGFLSLMLTTDSSTIHTPVMSVCCEWTSYLPVSTSPSPSPFKLPIRMVKAVSFVSIRIEPAERLHYAISTWMDMSIMTLKEV